MFLKIRLFVLIALLVVAPALLADQAAYLSKDQAKAALALLQDAVIVKFFCAPCGDAIPLSILIKNLEVMDTNYENYWEVQINNEGVDLAYIYFMSDNKWRNVAMALALPVEEVPEFLD